jgi:DNA-directed RNA polymerase subunit A'
MSLNQSKNMDRDIPSKSLSRIRFGILSPDTIRRMSVMEITTSETYDEAGNPVKGGIMDKRLGVAEPEAECETCGNDYSRCPGHFGRIELARPVIHPEFAKPIHDLLRATCRECGRVLLTDQEIERYRTRLERLKKHWRLTRDRVITKIVK